MVIPPFIQNVSHYIRGVNIYPARASMLRASERGKRERKRQKRPEGTVIIFLKDSKDTLSSQRLQYKQAKKKNKTHTRKTVNNIFWDGFQYDRDFSLYVHAYK